MSDAIMRGGAQRRLQFGSYLFVVVVAAAGCSASEQNAVGSEVGAGTTAAQAPPSGDPSANAGTSGGSTSASSGGAGSLASPAGGSAGSAGVGAGADGGDAGENTPPEDRAWDELIAADWEIEPGNQSYLCVRRTLEQDIVLSGFDPIVPLGTHHTTLSVGPAERPDGVEPCGGLDGADAGIWATGVNTPAFEFPPGVGMVLRAGQQMLLNLHLFNAGTERLRGRSGLAIMRRDRAEIEHVADVTLMGPAVFVIAPGAPVVVEGGCTFAQPATVFAISPHMHGMGRRMRLVAERAGQPERVLHDEAFGFGEQRTYPLEPLALDAGDRLRVECTFENDTERVVGFGESTQDEMCIAVVARYPAANQSFCIL